jgi:colicin import membrane protein
MPALQERMEFAPPRTPGLIRALILAMLAHGLLVAILTEGLAWKRNLPPVTAEAELWSAVPQAAPPPAPPEPQDAVPTPPNPPEPAPLVKPLPDPPKPVATPDPAIAIAREKVKQKQKLEQERLRRDQLEVEKLKKEKEQLVAQLQKAKEAKERAEAKKLEAMHLEQTKRAMSLAGGNGSPESTSKALVSSGPSPDYGKRIAALIRSNIHSNLEIAGNPRAEVEIRLSTSGEILSSRISQRSGVDAWDDAVSRAIEKTRFLPKDVDGTIPTNMTIGFRPQD